MKILIADDHPSALDGISHLILSKKSGVTLLLAADGAEAIRQVASFQPDLILMDLMMPGMGGVEAIRRLRQDDCEALIIANSIYSHLSRPALMAGADRFVDKYELARAIGELLDEVEGT
jgi:CheY-like chemotaxis protein